MVCWRRSCRKRSLTAGVASYEAEFDHMAELTGRAADEALATIRDRAAAA